MQKFYVKLSYERTSAIRKRNIKRKLTVIDRLKEQNIPFERKTGIFSVPYIPKNIQRLIVQLD